MLVVVLVTVLFTFALLHLVPGDPARTILGERATPQAVAALRARLHLNQPTLEQLWLFLKGAASGNLGTSLVAGSQPVSGIVFPALGITLELIGCSVLLSLLIGIPLGVVSGSRRTGAADVSIRVVLMTLLGMPSFLVGFLLLLLALDTGVAPVGGWGTTALSDLQHLWLPSLALSAYLVPVIGRVVRQSTVDTLSKDFVEAAIARGLPSRTLIGRHVIPNSLLPVISVVGLNIGGLIGGAAIIEIVFNLPGIGSALTYAVANRDYPVVQGTALVTAVIVILVNAIADVLYQVVDPRTRATR